jgi:hypothetical protein
LRDFIDPQWTETMPPSFGFGPSVGLGRSSGARHSAAQVLGQIHSRIGAAFTRRFTASTVRRWFVLVALIAVPALSPAAETLESVEKSAGEWVKLRVETSRLETAWKEERTLVESMVTALNERAVAAEEKRDLLKAKTAKDREELDGLRAKIETESNELQAFEARLKGLTGRLTALRPALPPRLSDALEMSFRSLENPALPPGERMQLAMNVLNRCTEFNRSVTVGEEVLTLDGEATAKSREVIYWGLSHGYVVDRATRKAWLGAPAGGGWRWEPKPEAFENVVRLIAIATDKADPEFVTVPATVTRSLSEKSRN